MCHGRHSLTGKENAAEADARNTQSYRGLNRRRQPRLATSLVTSLAAAISTDPLKETRSLDAVAGFLPVKRWVKKSPGGDDGAGE